MYMENVSNLLSADMREVMEYIIEKFYSNSLAWQEASRRGLQLTLCSSQWRRNWSTR